MTNTKSANIYKGKLPFQSEFFDMSIRWKNNHKSWAKRKKLNKRIAKRKLKQEWLRSKNDIGVDANEYTHN